MTIVSGLFLSGILSLILGVICFQKKRQLNTKALGLYQFFAGIWAFSYLGELLLPTVQQKMLTAVIAYTGLPFVPVLSFIIITNYVFPDVFIKRRQVLYLMIVPVITFLLISTNQFHELFYKNVHLLNVSGFNVLGKDAGIWFYVHVIYSYTMLMGSAITLVIYLFRSTQIFRSQTIILIIAIALPWVSNMFYVFNGTNRFDYTPIAFIFSGGFLIWGMNSLKLFDIVPAARAQVFESMLDSVFVVDARERIVDMNLSARMLVGEKKLLGKFLYELKDQLPSSLVDIFVKPPGEHEVVIGDATYAALISALVDTQTSLQGKIVSLRDITARKKAEISLMETENILRANEKNLIEINASKDRFFSIIAHDLKSPFTGIIGLVEILTDDFYSLSTEEQFKLLSSLKELSENTLKLLENLLQWAWSQTGKIRFEPRSLTVKLLINNCIIALHHTAELKNVKLDADISSDTVVFGDEEMIGSIFRNLISNAIKFSRSGDTIRIHCEQQSDGYHFQVQDSGIGISPEGIDKIFRIDQSYSQKGTAGERGTGLGLILCKEFIEKHNGRIWVDSTVGKGSTFTVLFPFQDYSILKN